MLYSNTSGYQNSAIGYSARYNTTGNGNSAIGTNALFHHWQWNSAIGMNAFQYHWLSELSNGDACLFQHHWLCNMAIEPPTGTESWHTSLFQHHWLPTQGAALYSTPVATTIQLSVILQETISPRVHNIAIGDNTDAPWATWELQLNIGNTIYGDLTNKRLSINVTSPTYQLQLSADSAAKPTSNTWTHVS